MAVNNQDINLVDALAFDMQIVMSYSNNIINALNV